MSEKVTINIDGQELAVPQGQKILWAALDNGIYIPHLCANEKEERPSASCRLCFVEIEGFPNLVASCAQEVQAGMVITTRSQRIDRLVATGFELLLSNHRLGCAKCSANGRCALQKIAKERGLKLKVSRLRSLLQDIPVDDSPETFVYDPTRCVLCGHCVWVEQNETKTGAINFIRRGMGRKVATFGDGQWAEANCSQECVKACPVGALFFKM